MRLPLPRPFQSLKRFLPRSLLGRSLLIMLMPMIITQGVALQIFYGNNLAIWPQTFEQYVAAYMASQVITKLTQDKQTIAALLTPRRGILDTAKSNALNKAAMAANKHRVAISKWVLARVGARSGGPLGDGGNPGSLIG